MLHSDSINLYQDLFIPPKGYQIDWVEITTWSLAKDFLRILPAMIFAANSASRPSKMTAVNSYIKLSNNAEAPFHLFYDAKNVLEQEDKNFYLTPNGKYVLYMLSTHCTAITLPKGGLFHPKIIFLQFKSAMSGQESYFYRVCISSKNLTWSNYCEGGVVLESQKITDNEPYISHTEEGNPATELCGFFKKYYGEEYCYNADVRGRCKINFEFLKKASFEVINKAKEEKYAARLYFNRREYHADKKKVHLYGLICRDLETYHNIAVKNTNYSVKMRILSMNPQDRLWKAYQSIQQEYICNFHDAYEEDLKRNGHWRKKQDRSEGFWYVGKSEKEPYPLHIKQYLMWIYSSNTKQYTYPIVVWIGSANCSEKGLKGDNEEVLVRYETFSSVDGELNGTDFPCKGPGNGYEILKKRVSGADVTMHCYSPKQVMNPAISSVEDEDPRLPILNISIEKSVYKNSELSFYIKNNERDVLEIRPATLDFDQIHLVKAGVKERLRFAMDKHHFSNVVLIKFQKSLYFHVLDIPWEGKQYEELVREMPIPAVSSLAELISYKDYFEHTDDVFERIMKCKLMETPKDYLELLRGVKDNIALYSNLCVIDEPDEEITQQVQNVNQLFSDYRRELEMFIKLIESEINCNGVD